MEHPDAREEDCPCLLNFLGLNDRYIERDVEDAILREMELYLRWLEEHERQPGEEPPIGLILCASRSDEKVKLLRLDQGNIRVVAYMTDLPPKKLLEKKLHEAAQLARHRLAGGTQQM